MSEELQQQRLTFPHMNVHVAPQGVIVTTHLTPASAFTQVLDIATIKQLLPLLKDVLKQEQANQQTQLAVIRHINGTKQ